MMPDAGLAGAHIADSVIVAQCAAIGAGRSSDAVELRFAQTPVVVTRAFEWSSPVTRCAR
jgi:hypothetical protein